MSRSRVLAFAAALLLALGLARPALAHDYFVLDGKAQIPIFPVLLGFEPDSVIVVPLGGTTRVLVDDVTDCKAFLTAFEDEKSDVFSLSPDPKGSRVSHIYRIRGEEIGVGVLEIDVLGDGEGCNEDSQNLFWVVVVDEKTAAKDMQKFLKQSVSGQKKANKGFLKSFGQEVAEHVADAAAGVISVDEAFDLIDEDLEDALDFADAELEQRLFDIYDTAAAILEETGYTSMLVGPPDAFSSNDCSPYRVTTSWMGLELRKTYDKADQVAKKGIDKLIKIGGGDFGLAISTDEPVIREPLALDFGPVSKSSGCPNNKIRSVKCRFLAQFNTRSISVKGKADLAQGAMVEVTIEGPKDSMGVPAYSTVQMATVGSDCKWKVTWQDSSITPGSGTVTAVHASGTATKTFTCN